MGAAPSSSSPHAAATAAVCDAIERVVGMNTEYARELHDFAVQRMESDAALAVSDLKSSQSERHKQAERRSAALSNQMKERLLNDFLPPNSRFHAAMRSEIANPSNTELVSARNRVPLDNSKTGALAPPSPLPAVPGAEAAHIHAASAPAMTLAAPAASFAAAGSSSAAAAGSGSATGPSPAAIFNGLSAFEQERAIRAGVETEVQRVWQELEVARHYENMSVQKSFAQKEAALQQALVQTFAELEF